jgi:hypothetical protein
MGNGEKDEVTEQQRSPLYPVEKPDIRVVVLKGTYVVLTT